jgi:hypothetical protein
MLNSRYQTKSLSTPIITFNLWAMCGAIGIRVILPILLFVPSAIALDKAFHTLPWITIVSLPLAMATSILLIKRDLERMSFTQTKIRAKR